MTRFQTTALMVVAAVLLGGCGGGSGTQRSSPSPSPSLSSPAFVYISNTNLNTLTGISVAGGTPANLASTLPTLGGTAPVGLVATGKFLYVADSGSGDISGFSFDANSGALQPLPGSPYTAATGVNSLALCPGNGGPTAPRFVYAVASSAVLGYSIGIDGRLTAVPASPFTAGSHPAAVAADLNCTLVFVANQGSNNISAFTVNSSTGSLTAVPGSPFAAGSAPVGLATGDNFLFAANSGSNDVSVFTISTGIGTGALLTQVSGSPFSAGTEPSALVYFSPTLYVANSGSNNVSAFSVTPGTGTLTPVPGSPFSVGTQPKALIALSPPAGNLPQQFFLYVANNGSNDLSAFTIGGNGVLSPVQGFPFPAGVDPQGLAFACGLCGYP